ncbi:MFS transporter [Noviherbaspirillum sedimenti]|uniref:MFS transporter n=1 Tax=Noviherbaspirillum sedimenti TaxID=2320865 RepID=A0A3A3FY45_9BURK|nr:MFS transporter [Noviherbaspirillum sedimenti]RJG01067.1 MFS transporter [Noviherbaspirillum sedimenti]
MWQQMAHDERRKMAIVLGLTLIYGCVLGAQFYVARLVNALGGSATDAGLLLILSVLPVFGVALLGKRLTQTIPPPQMLRLGLACHALQLLLLGLASNLTLLLPAMLLSGFGYALSFVTLLNGATTIAPSTHYAQGIAYMTLCSQLGIGLGSLVSALTEPVLGTNGVFWVPMLLALIGLVLASRLPAAAAVLNAAPPAQARTPPRARPGARSWRTVLHGRMVEIFILMGMLGLAFGVPLQFVPMWLAKTPEMAFSPAYFLTTSFFTIMLTRLLFSQHLSGPRELHVVVACFVVLALAIAVLGQARTPAQFAACAIAYGGAYSLLYPSCTAYVLRQAEPAERGAWANWVLLAYELGTRVLPAAFGMVADHGGFPLSFLLLAGVVAAVSAWHVMKRRQAVLAPA